MHAIQNIRPEQKGIEREKGKLHLLIENDLHALTV